jgi:glutaredoxin-related protein
VLPFALCFGVLTTYGIRIRGFEDAEQLATFPQLIIDGEFVGGLDVVKDMVDNGELVGLIAQ